jgi:hypothetical protein
VSQRPAACRSLLLLCALVAPLSLAGCGSSGSGSGEPVTRDTTVMVYFLGSDLVEGALGNIAEMMLVGSTDNLNVVIQTGGAKDEPTTHGTDPKSLHPSDIDWRRVQRFKVNKGSLQRVDDLGLETTSSNPAIDMGSARTLKDFLAWGAKDFPAKKFIAILWDHGGGVNFGIGRDDITNSKMSVADISQTLKQATVQGMKLEIVGFDACVMATAEVAASLYQISNYMVASQDNVPQLSWSYEPFLNYVTTNPSVGGKEIGTKIVDAYVEKMKANRIESATLSVVELSKTKALVEATDAFSTALAPYAARQDGWRQIARARWRSLDWGTNPMTGATTDLVDMRTFVSKVVENITELVQPDDALTGAGIALGDAIESAVVYNKATGSDDAATGLTLYFPASLWAYPDSAYPANTTVGGVPYFANAYTDGTSGLVKTYFEFYRVNIPALQVTVTMNGTPADPLSATISSYFYNVIAANQSASCKVYDLESFQLTPPPPCFYAMQDVPSTTAIPGGASQVTFSNTAGWPHLTDGAGHSFPVPLIPEQLMGYKIGDSNEYLVPVFKKVGDKGLAGNLIVEEQFPVVPGPRTYNVTGFLLAGAIPGKAAPLKDGEVFAMAAHVYLTREAKYQFMMTDREVTVSGGTLTVSYKAISGGQFGYLVTDLTGALQTSNVLVPYAPVP